MPKETPPPPIETPKSDQTEATWEWYTGADIDTVRMRALAEKLSQEQPPPAGADPYNRTPPAPEDLSQTARRRTLDDMRRLSENIKRKRRDPAAE